VQRLRRLRAWCTARSGEWMRHSRRWPQTLSLCLGR
jgi:hypothetical protein